MKNISILVENLSVDYALDAISGISDFFKDKDVCLSIFHVHRPNAAENDYSYQYWIGTQFLKSKNIDAIIVITGCFLSYYTPENLAKTLSFLDSSKIVSMAVPIPGFSRTYTYTKCENIYKKIVSHLKEKHNCKKIAFVSANNSGSIEAFDRFEAYKKALADNGLEYDPALVIDSNFTYGHSYAALKEKYVRKEDVNFDAIIAACDMMAFACITALNEIGLNVPDDVKVIGFDDIYKAKHTTPTLSTVNQQISKQGYESAVLAYEIASGHSVPDSKFIEIDPCYRQSCGCEPIENTDLLSYSEKEENSTAREEIYTSSKFQDTINYFLDQMQHTETLEQFYHQLDPLVSTTAFSATAICLYEEPIITTYGNEFTLPNRVHLAAIAEHKKIGAQTTNITFNPNKQIIPDDIFSTTKGTFMFFPIFNGEKQFGYFFCKIDNKTYFQHHIYMKVLSHCVSLAYDYSKSLQKNSELSLKNEVLQKKNTHLNIQSITDELTSILNRRGFMEMGQKTIDFALDLNKSGLVCFSDMDGLKKINDTFGHEMGDKAIIAQSEILTKTFRGTDVVGRLSGDEFAVVVPGMNLSQINKIRTKIQNISESVSKDYDLPFEVSLSIGGVEFNSQNNDLQNLLKQADKAQYEEKKQKHKERKD